MKVLISSTSEDLKEHRQAAAAVVRDAQCEAVAMEHGPADPRPIVDVCREWVRDCDLVILIVAFRRGWVPSVAQGGDATSSITALEIAEADRLKRPVLAFFADDNWPGKLWDDDSEARAWVKAFRANLSRAAKFFAWETDPKLPSFRALISQELANYRTRHVGRAESSGLRAAEAPAALDAAVTRRSAPIPFRIFLSSPGDVSEERTKAREVLLGLARSPFLRDKVLIDVVSWDDPYAPAPMDARLTPQQAVDRGLRTPGECDLTVVILWSRMGTPLAEKKSDGTPYQSGTEWEFERALEANRTVLVYRRSEKVLLDADAPEFDDKLEQKRRVDAFFKTFIGPDGTLRRSYTSYASTPDFTARLEKDVEHVLHGFLERAWATISSAVTSSDALPIRGEFTTTSLALLPPEVPAAYRAWVLRLHGGIDLLGLQLRKARPPSLASIYVPQSTIEVERAPKSGKKRRPVIDVDMEGHGREGQRRVLALNRLNAESLFVSGAPGTGKSTFCRRVACLVAEGATPTNDGALPDGFNEELGEGLKGRLPLLLKLRELTDYLPPKQALTPADLQSAIDAWVVSKQPDGLNPTHLHAHLAFGSTLVILDGMDEVPVTQTNQGLTWHPRAQLVAVLSEMAPRWTQAGNRLLVTSRPYGLTTEDARRLQLQAAPLLALPVELQHALADRWFAALTQDADSQARTASDLFANIEAQPWLVELAGNPLLLTAMCIVFDEGKRLPQDKHELYDKVVTTVLFSRYPDPADIDRVKRELGTIAYGMHTGVEVDPGRATPKPEATFHEVEHWLDAYHKEQAKYLVQAQHSSFETREQLLSDSGLLLSTGDARAGFAHFSFQDFFAAQRALDVDEASLAEFFKHRAQAPEWRNALSFLFGRVAGVFTEPKKAIDLLESCLKLATVDEPGLPLALWDAAAILTGKKIDLRPETLESLKALLIGSMKGAAPISVRAEAASALGRIGDPRFHGARLWYLPADELLGFIEVPAGVFTMGSDPEKDTNAFDWEQPQHQVELSEFFIAKYPVTVAQFKAFVDDTGFEVGDADCLRCVPNHPVAWVSWHEALAYCEWLTTQLRTSDATPASLRTKLAEGWAVTLPSEAQWERAARGTDGRIYPWGDQFQSKNTNCRDTGLNGTSAVGLFGAGRSPAGAMDTIGNVWEWTRSLWGDDLEKPTFTYPYDRTDLERENLNAPDDVRRVVRGGSFNNLVLFLRAAYRNWNSPDSRYDYLGFRVVSSRLRP